MTTAIRDTPPLRRTKAELEAELEAHAHNQSAMIEHYEAALEEARSQTRAAQQATLPDREAQALSDCAKALDDLGNPPERGHSNQSSFGFTSIGVRAHTEHQEQVERILLLLAQRHGIDLMRAPKPVGPNLGFVVESVRGVAQDLNRVLDGVS